MFIILRFSSYDLRSGFKLILCIFAILSDEGKKNREVKTKVGEGGRYLRNYSNNSLQKSEIKVTVSPKC